MRERNTLAGFLHDLDVRISRQERHTHPRSGGIRISSDPNNALVPGSAPGLYSRQAVAKATEPTTYDFGGPIPLHAVWLQIGGEGGGGSVSFIDDFERADGPIGPDWVWHPAVVHPDGTPGGQFSIEDGAAIAPMDTFSTVMFWHEPMGDAQCIEITVEDAVGNDGWFTLHANMSPTVYASRKAEFTFYDALHDWVPTPADELWVELTGGAFAGPLPYPDEPFTLGLEVDPDGTMRATVNGVVVVTGLDPNPPPGEFVGMEMDPASFSGDSSPRILSVTGTCPGAVAPEIAEMKAWTGTEWESGPARGWDGSQWVDSSAVHVWDGRQWLTSTT